MCILQDQSATRNQTYMANFELSKDEVLHEFQLTGNILNEYVDFSI